MNPENFIPPGRVLGILGGGQLGRMFAMAAHSMGYQVAVLDPDKKSPAGVISEFHICAEYDDEKALQKMVSICSVISTEFENVPGKVLRYLEQYLPVHPSSSCVSIAQNRIREKNFFNQSGAKTAEYRAIQSKVDLDALDSFPFPAILKTAEFGYDGKGQIVCQNQQDVVDGYEKLGMDCLLEKMVDLEREVSVILARSFNGEIKIFPIAENHHENGILDRTLAPARINQLQQKLVLEQAKAVAEGFDYVGILAIEFFITKSGDVLVNEMAPRTHNSGHYTMNGCVTSQFEQQVRTLIHSALGDSALIAPAAMLNILGDSWQNGEPNWFDISSIAGVSIHLYGKKEPRVGRKMGHLNIVAESESLLEEKIEKVRSLLQ